MFYKVKSEKFSVKYKGAVEEALCFGWIDSVVKRIDDEKHMQKYTPRKHNSNWSAKNKKRVNRLVKEGRMTELGLEKIKIAKENGSCNKLDSVDIRIETPEDLYESLNRNKAARDDYDKLPPSRKKQFLW